ncbi:MULTISPECIES: hypothetical protein [unclassified Streptomyces]|nr:MULTISPECIES: hypothetical protein [unclassified Streptomyces]MCF0087180.1 hypothetical protein [Streptomyces sp. MH192]MCF0098982.1 hypothetical protein [Streptomyces sp. MH191]
MTNYLVCGRCHWEITPGQQYKRIPIDRPSGPPVMVIVHAGCAPGQGAGR